MQLQTQSGKVPLPGGFEVELGAVKYALRREIIDDQKITATAGGGAGLAEREILATLPGQPAMGGASFLG